MSSHTAAIPRQQEREREHRSHLCRRKTRPTDQGTMEALAGGQPLSARARRIARSREEMLGLLADFSGDGDDSDRELSFSDLVDVVSRPPNASQAPTAAVAAEEEAVTSKKQHAAAAAGKERRQRRRRSDSRGSCGGGGDGVLLNFYVPGLLTRSMTAPRHGRGSLPAAACGAAHGAPAKVAAGKSRIQASLAIGCWPALWGRGRDHRNKPV
uniref:Uncharacterized protein n=1 Tax=Avena sativa TaxID=4498 RepID=A0ACD5TA26_AVESA